jgi:hypothetical protein
VLRVDIPEPLLTASAMKMQETRRAWTTQAEQEVVGQRGESPLSAYAGTLPLLIFAPEKPIFSPPSSLHPRVGEAATTKNCHFPSHTSTRQDGWPSVRRRARDAAQLDFRRDCGRDRSAQRRAAARICLHKLRERGLEAGRSRAQQCFHRVLRALR